MAKRPQSAVYNLYAAKTLLSELVERAARGEEIVIAKAGVPRARLVPVQVARRRAGGWEGKVKIAADFDDPLPEAILAAFEGRSE